MSKVTIVEIELSGTVCIDITEKDIKTIAEEYGGNYKDFIDDLEHDRFDIEWDEDRREYSEVSLIKALNDYKKENNMDLNFNYPPEVIKEKFLSCHEISESYFLDVLQNDSPLAIDPDKETLKECLRYADNSNPNRALNGIYIDDKHIVATNTRVLISHANKTGLSKVWIPKEFARAYIYDDALLYVSGKSKIFMRYKNKFYAYNCATNGKYPDYERIIPKETKDKFSLDEFGKKSAIYKSELGIKILCFSKDKETKVFLDHDYIKDIKFDNFCINEHNLPVVFEDENKKIVVMPLKLDESDIRKLKKNV